MKFLVPNYSWLQNPWLGSYRPQNPVLSVVCPQLNLLNPPNKIPGYSIDCTLKILALSLHSVIKFPRHGYFLENIKFGKNSIIFIYCWSQ